jgi:hypothetical protein
MRATPRSGPCAISDRAVRLRCWITRGLSKGLSNLRHELGRTNDSPWFRYTFHQRLCACYLDTAVELRSTPFARSTRRAGKAYLK